MPEQLAIPGSESSDLTPRELAYLEACELATRRALEPHSARTKAAYRHEWRRWARYCEEMGVPRMPPISPAHLTAYLEFLSRSLAPNTVRLALSALVSLDQAARMSAAHTDPHSLRKHPIVTRWLESWERDHPVAPRRRAPALSADELERILRAAAERPRNVSPAQHAAKYTRDRCVWLLGVTAALRVSELVALDAGDVQRAERGLRVLVRTSKTDQRGAGHLRGVSPQARLIVCPVEAFAQWSRLRGDAPGPLFVAITRSGELARERLTVRQVQAMIGERARAAGLSASAHSLRATFATLAAERRKAMHRIADQGAWKSLSVLRGYIRQGALFDDNPSAGLLE